VATIVGNLRPEDDYPHAAGSAANFNESMYFNFFDCDRGLGGFVRIGNRPNEGYAETTVALFRPNGRVLFTFDRPRIANNERMEAGGLRFEVVTPAETLRTTFAGRLLDLAEPRDMADPRKAFRDNPARPVTLDLTHEAVGPMYGSSGDAEEEERAADDQFAKAHYEQHMRVTGSIDLDGEATRIDGYGLRDHSWGPRSWQAIRSYEWLTMNFGADLGAMVSIIRRDGTPDRIAGVVVRGDRLDPIVAAEVEADYEANGLYHRAVRTRVTTRGGEALSIDGTVRGFLPLRNRRDGRTTHIGEGMTEWRLGDRVGYGLSELLRQVE